MIATQSVIIADTNYLSMQGLQRIVSGHPDLKVKTLLNYPEDIKHFDIGEADICIANLSHHTEIVCQQAIDWNKSAKVLAITDIKSEIQIQKLWQNGIESIVTNQCSEDEISQAISNLSGNEKFFCNSILNLLSQKNKKQTIEELSTRELEVLDLIVKGKSSKKISEQLYLSHHTVNSHRKNILKKLNLSSPAELIVYAMDHGFSQS